MSTLANKASHPWKARQQGITLVIALIMLTVLTIIAITVANMATVDLKIVANQQAAQQARAAAESGLDVLVNDVALLETLAPFSPKNNDPFQKEPHTVTAPDGSWTANIMVQRMGEPLPCPKASLPTDIKDIYSSSSIRCVYFEINSTGTSSKGAARTLTRGFYRQVAGFGG